MPAGLGQLTASERHCSHRLPLSVNGMAHVLPLALPLVPWHAGDSKKSFLFPLAQLLPHATRNDSDVGQLQL